MDCYSRLLTAFAREQSVTMSEGGMMMLSRDSARFLKFCLYFLFFVFVRKWTLFYLMSLLSYTTNSDSRETKLTVSLETSQNNV